jgi:hypothetical protein
MICARVCVRACARACERACTHAFACTHVNQTPKLIFGADTNPVVKAAIVVRVLAQIPDHVVLAVLLRQEATHFGEAVAVNCLQALACLRRERARRRRAARRRQPITGQAHRATARTCALALLAPGNDIAAASGGRPEIFVKKKPTATQPARRSQRDGETDRREDRTELTDDSVDDVRQVEVELALDVARAIVRHFLAH